MGRSPLEPRSIRESSSAYPGGASVSRSIDRRQFCCTAAAGASDVRPASTRSRGYLRSAHQGGARIDPSLAHAIRDVGDRQAASPRSKPASREPPTSIDARGKLVAPGSDRHPLPCRHAARTAPPLCLRTAYRVGRCRSAVRTTSTLISARSRYSRHRRSVARSINIARTGVVRRRIARPQPRQRSSCARRHRAPSRCRRRCQGAAVGRTSPAPTISSAAARAGSRPTLQAARDDPRGPESSPMRAILALLKRGDIVTHLTHRHRTHPRRQRATCSRM